MDTEQELRLWKALALLAVESTDDHTFKSMINLIPCLRSERAFVNYGVNSIDRLLDHLLYAPSTSSNERLTSAITHFKIVIKEISE